MTDQTVLEFVRWFMEKNGFAPAIREIAQGIGLSKTATAWHMTRLERAGAIQRIPGKRRVIRVVQ